MQEVIMQERMQEVIIHCSKAKIDEVADLLAYKVKSFTKSIHARADVIPERNIDKYITIMLEDYNKNPIENYEIIKDIQNIPNKEVGKSKAVFRKADNDQNFRCILLISRLEENNKFKVWSCSMFTEFSPKNRSFFEWLNCEESVLEKLMKLERENNALEAYIMQEVALRLQQETGKLLSIKYLG